MHKLHEHLKLFVIGYDNSYTYNAQTNIYNNHSKIDDQTNIHLLFRMCMCATVLKYCKKCMKVQTLNEILCPSIEFNREFNKRSLQRLICTKIIVIIICLLCALIYPLCLTHSISLYRNPPIQTQFQTNCQNNNSNYAK